MGAEWKAWRSEYIYPLYVAILKARPAQCGEAHKTCAIAHKSSTGKMANCSCLLLELKFCIRSGCIGFWATIKVNRAGWTWAPLSSGCVDGRCVNYTVLNRCCRGVIWYWDAKANFEQANHKFRNTFHHICYDELFLFSKKNRKKPFQKICSEGKEWSTRRYYLWQELIILYHVRYLPN